jgi:hypothetical protein
MLSAAEGEPEGRAEAVKPVEATAPAADDSGAQVPRVTKALLLGAAFVFLVLPAVAMLFILTSGSSLSDLLDSAMSEFGKQLSSVGNRL